jgi:hypothetical protein
MDKSETKKGVVIIITINLQVENGYGDWHHIEEYKKTSPN